MDAGLLLQIFWTFFLIGLFNFGGGGAMISLIQSQVVTLKGWISEEMFTNIVAVSQSTPGPIGINCATYVGYEVAGVAGSSVATLALVLPSFLIFFALVKVYEKYRSGALVGNVMTALKPAVVGMLGAAALILMFRFDADAAEFSIIRENFGDWTSWALLGGTLVASLWRKVNPIALIVAGGVIGVIIY